MHGVHLTAGTKVEHNDFSGVEIQPTGRISWQPTPSHSAWGAVSRAVRVPTRLERDISIDLTDPSAAVARCWNREFDPTLCPEAGYAVPIAGCRSISPRFATSTAGLSVAGVRLRSRNRARPPGHPGENETRHGTTRG